MHFVRSLLSNLTTLLLALILAVTVWATAIRADDPVENRILEIEVQTVGAPPDAELLNRPPESALITIEGRPITGALSISARCPLVKGWCRSMFAASTSRSKY
jgi:hypothetical protein